MNEYLAMYRAKVEQASNDRDRLIARAILSAHIVRSLTDSDPSERALALKTLIDLSLNKGV